MEDGSREKTVTHTELSKQGRPGIVGKGAWGSGLRQLGEHPYLGFTNGPSVLMS